MHDYSRIHLDIDNSEIRDRKRHPSHMSPQTLTCATECNNTSQLCVRVSEAFAAVPGAAGGISAIQAACTQQSPLAGWPVQSLLSMSSDGYGSINPYSLHFTVPRRRQSFTDAVLSGTRRMEHVCTAPEDGRGACRSRAIRWTRLRHVLL